jgi:hypothetical protein
MTSRKPNQRLAVARADLGSADAVILGLWPHHRAFLVEKVAHFWLDNMRIAFEWFAVDAPLASEAVRRAIEAVDADMVQSAWFSSTRPAGCLDEKFYPMRDRLIVDRTAKAAEFRRRVNEAGRQDDASPI